jgi:pimeloyl-ACP methyl ester carboxylesterase
MAATAPTFIDSTDGVRLALHELGGPAVPGAPVILFSHATGFHGQVWWPLAAELTDRFRCVGVDLRGHGMTELPAGVSADWTGMADDVAAVLESGALGDADVHGVGHSMGGAALVMAAARLPGAFRSLWLYEPVIVPPDAGLMTDGPNPMSEAAARRRDRFDSVEQAVANYGSKPPLDQLHPDALVAYVRGGFAPQGDGSIVLRCRPSVEADVFRFAASSGGWAAATGLDVPTAVVAGRRGGMGPVAFAPFVAAVLPQGTLFDRPGLEHFGPLEDPAGMAGDIRAWIEDHP